MNNPANITATKASYLKLGEGGRWERQSLDEGKLLFGFHTVPHGIGQDADAIRQLYLAQGRTAGTATDFARQITTFYKSDDRIWITFADGYLWWCQAEPEVVMLTQNPNEGPSRYRLTKDGWRNTSVRGTPLRMSELNGALTKTAAYRSSVCDLSPAMLDYLLRRINDQETEAVKVALNAEQQLLIAIDGLMQQLQPQDLELLVDLIFSQSGWRRISSVGGTLKITDMDIELPSTGEQAIVQVKSETTQTELDGYVTEFNARGLQRMFYVYHTSKKPLVFADDQVVLIDQQKLSRMVLDAGLFSWLLRKAQ